MRKKLIRFTVFLMMTALFAVSVASVIPQPVAAATGSASASKKVRTVKTKKLKMKAGQVKTLKAQKLKGKIKWKSSKKKVASVTKRGVVTAKKAGSAKITATAGKKRYVFKVTVKKAAKKQKTTTKAKTDTGNEKKAEEKQGDSEEPGPAGGKKEEAAPAADDGDPLEVHFIDVGQGDATLLTCGGEAMMVDFGDNSKGTYLQKYLMDRKIKALSYGVGTHPDADHIGGEDVILYKFPTQHVLMPDVTNDTATYRDVVDTCKARNYRIEHPAAGTSFKLGSATVKVLAPNSASYDDMNSYSIVLMVTKGKNRFLLTGDATTLSEDEMLKKGYDLSADVLKVGHHGSYTSTSDAFLKAVSPEYAVISCGKDNRYGHPHDITMKKLKKAGVKIFRTDTQGTVVARADGEKITWSVKNTGDFTGGSGSASDTEAVAKAPESGQAKIISAPQPAPSAETATDYVMNTNTMKVHLPGCSSVGKMSAKNRKDVTDTLENLKKQGYDPCGICLQGK